MHPWARPIFMEPNYCCFLIKHSTETNHTTSPISLQYFQKANITCEETMMTFSFPTRKVELVIIPLETDRAFSRVAPKLWNEPPVELPGSISIGIFIQSFKRFYIKSPIFNFYTSLIYTGNSCIIFIILVYGYIAFYMLALNSCDPVKRRPVSSVGRVPDYRAGGRGFEPRPDHHSGSLK